MSALRFVTANILIALAATVNAQDVPRDEHGFTEFAATQLRRQVGTEEVIVKSPLTLGLGELQANLDRVFRFCSENADGCADELDRYVKGVAQVYRERNAPPSKEAVRIVIRTTQYLQAAQASSATPGLVQLLPRPFVEGLVTLPVLDAPRSLKPMGERDAEKLGLSEREVYELGLANLRNELKPLSQVAKVARRGEIGQLVGDVLQPSRLLLVDTWLPLVQEQGGVLIVAIPATDAVFYIGEDTPSAIDALRSLVKNVMSKAPNRLSNTLLRWRDSRWEVVRQ